MVTGTSSSLLWTGSTRESRVEHRHLGKDTHRRGCLRSRLSSGVRRTASTRVGWPIRRRGRPSHCRSGPTGAMPLSTAKPKRNLNVSRQAFLSGLGVTSLISSTTNLSVAAGALAGCRNRPSTLYRWPNGVKSPKTPSSTRGRQPEGPSGHFYYYGGSLEPQQALAVRLS